MGNQLMWDAKSGEQECEGWWVSGYHSSVAEHWLHKPGVLGLIPGDCRVFHLLTSNIPTRSKSSKHEHPNLLYSYNRQYPLDHPCV